MEYEIVSYDLTDGRKMYVLSNKDRTFIDDLSNDAKKLMVARDVYAMADKIALYGIEWALRTETLKTIKSNISLLELRIKGKVTRVMVYLYEETQPIYLFDFKGHQGKSGHIKRNVLERAERLAIIAENAMKESDDYEKRERP